MIGKRNTSLAAKGALAHRLQRRTAAPPAKSKMAARGPKMAEGVWTGVYPYVFGHSKQLLLNKFFDPSTPSMRKGRDGGKTGKKRGKKRKKREKTDDYSGHYVIDSSRLPERRPLERRPLVPKIQNGR